MPAKIEGLAFGQDVTVDGEVEHTLYVSNDNDFLSQVPLADGTLVDNPNQFFVFGFTDADLAKFGVDNFDPQDVAAVPEPSTWAMMIFGFLGSASWPFAAKVKSCARADLRPRRIARIIQRGKGCVLTARPFSCERSAGSPSRCWLPLALGNLPA